MLIGSLSYQNSNYTLYCDIPAFNTSSVVFCVLTDMHIEDRRNGTLDHRLISDFSKERIFDPNYVIGFRKVSLSTSKSLSYGDTYLINEVERFISFVINDECSKNEVLADTVDMNDLGVIENYYSKKTSSYELSYYKIGDKYTSFSMEYNGMSIHLQKCPLGSKLREVYKVSTEANHTLVPRVTRELLNQTFDFNDVKNKCDISWYIDPFTNEYKKDYGCVHNKEELAKEIVFPFIKHYKELVARNEEVVFTIDTEGTGLMMYDLSKNNPSRDYVTAIPVSWKENFGRTIFIRMKYLNNLEVDSALKFISEIAKEVWYLENKLVDLWQDGFEDIDGCPPREEFILDRTKYRIVGHNVSYDTRAFLTDDTDVWWDDNTLQMAFIMNPTTVKAKIPHIETKVVTDIYGVKSTKTQLVYVNPGNGLKPITKRLLDYEPLELSTILGKGAEGNYHLIKDEEVAKVYGCADADGTFIAYKRMKKMIEENSDLLERYREQDMFLTNIWARFDFKGIKIDYEGLKEVAECAIKDREILRKFIQNYVGKLVNTQSKYLALRRLYLDNKLTKEEFEEQTSKISEDKNSIYEFEFTPAAKTKVLYDIAHYPKLKTNKKDKNGNIKEITASVDALKTLMTYKVKSKILLDDVLSSDGKTVLIPKDEFNKYKYPLAYLFKMESDLTKDITGFYNPLLQDNLEGKLFADTRMNGTETRRIIHRFQTVKKHVKKFFKPYDESFINYDQDMSQIEYRKMAYAAGQWNMVERLLNLEADFHTESAAMLTGQPPHQITHDFRSSMKCVNFGIPYGLGPKSLCITMFGEYNEINLAKTHKMLNMFYEANPAVMKMLYAARDACTEPVEFTDEFKRFNGFVEYDEEIEKDPLTGRLTTKYIEKFKPVGRACNDLGFWRLFDLSRKDTSTLAAYKRAAGNEPIQGSASDGFRTCLIRYYKALCKNGLRDKVIWHIPIHDEIFYSVKKDVHPYLIYKIVREACMLKVPEYDGRYYTWGIGVGTSWKTAKSDDAEAPQMFLDYAIEMYDKGIWNKPNDNYPQMIQEHMRYWAREVRILDEVKLLCPDFTDTLDIDLFIKNLVNYKVREYILPFEDKYYKEKGKELTPEKHLAFSLIGWLNELGDNYKVKLGDKIALASDYIPKEDNSIDDLFVDLDFLDGEIGDVIELDLNANNDEEDDFHNMDADEIIASVVMLNELEGDGDDEEYSPYLRSGITKEGNVLKLEDELKSVNTGFGHVTNFMGVYTVKLPTEDMYGKVSKVLGFFKSNDEDDCMKVTYKVKDNSVATSTFFGGYNSPTKYRTIKGMTISPILTNDDIDSLVETLSKGDILINNGLTKNLKCIGHKVTILKSLTTSQLVSIIDIIKKTTSKNNLPQENVYTLYTKDNKLLAKVDVKISPIAIDKFIDKLMKEVNLVG